MHNTPYRLGELPPRTTGFGYDYGLGLDPVHIQYIKQSHIIQSRISPTPCYLIQQVTGGMPVGYPGARITPLSAAWVVSDAQYRLTLWEGGSNHPDMRQYVNNGRGNIHVYYSGTPMTRVLTPEDIIANTEFAVVERRDVSPTRVEVVFNRGFTDTSNVTYHYLTWEDGVEDLANKRGDSVAQSVFGWSQYKSSHWDDFQRPNQVLVRFPINLNDIVIMDEGRTVIENRDSWMIWYPYVDDFDILVLAADDSPDGQEHRYEIVNSTNSIIQRELVSQRFKLNLIEASDPRYNIPYVTSA
jgi:hypothetical protein